MHTLPVFSQVALKKKKRKCNTISQKEKNPYRNIFNHTANHGESLDRFTMPVTLRSGSDGLGCLSSFALCFGQSTCFILPDKTTDRKLRA